jgi:hypothetical protein
MRYFVYIYEIDIYKLIQERARGTHWLEVWVDVEKRKFLTLPGLELRPLGHPARSQSVYRLRYPPRK